MLYVAYDQERKCIRKVRNVFACTMHSSLPLTTTRPVPIALGKILKIQCFKTGKNALKHCSNFQNSVQKSFKGLKHSLGEFISMNIFLPNGPTVGYIIMFRAPAAQAS